METNFNQYLCKHFRRITLDNNKDGQSASKENLATPRNIEVVVRNVLRKEQPEENGLFINIDELVPFFIEECKQNCLHVDPCFASYYLHLLVRDSQHGIEQNTPPQEIYLNSIEKFILRALKKIQNSTDATVICMKISFYCKNSQGLELNFVKEKTKLDFSNKLKKLIDSILQYPETSNNKQIEQMFVKMQVFIITNYQIGYPENHVLLSRCRQSLNSILTKGDIQKYVLKKKYHRLEYLRKLGATAAGILIFNNQGPEGDKENMRNRMAICNTKESLQEGFDRVHHLKQKAYKVMLDLIEINIQQTMVYYLRPNDQIRELNKFVILFEVYRENLEKLKIAFEKTKYVMENDQKKFDCVVEKINEILKYRTAIETEKIFPHFVYLSEIWNCLMLYINHLVEINKIKDHLDELLNKEMDKKFNEILDDLSDKSTYLKHRVSHSFQDIINSTAKRTTKLNMLNIKPFVKDYCALTMALTGGFLVPSQLEKKLCENVYFSFGFFNMEYAKFAELHFKDFINTFRTTVLISCDLMVLFNLDEEVMQQVFEPTQQKETKSLGTQTELIAYEKKPRNQIKETWNIWDFHRQTIKLANIKTKQTHSTQTNISFGIRNAQMQCERKLEIPTQK